MSAYWFRPKTHGYGASPANWKGWAATVGFIVAVNAILWPWVLSPAINNETPTIAGVVASVALIVIATLGFIWLCKIKTDGEWEWRWGNKT